LYTSTLLATSVVVARLLLAFDALLAAFVTSLLLLAWTERAGQQCSNDNAVVICREVGLS
jgi:hypothetical protein